MGKVLFLAVSSFLFKTHMLILVALPQRTWKPAIIIVWGGKNALSLTSRAEACLGLMAFYGAGMISLVRKARVSKEIADIEQSPFVIISLV